jgi:hypothetical protein
MASASKLGLAIGTVSCRLPSSLLLVLIVAVSVVVVVVVVVVMVVLVLAVDVLVVETELLGVSLLEEVPAGGVPGGADVLGDVSPSNGGKAVEATPPGYGDPLSAVHG